MIRLTVAGAAGKMGQMILKCALRQKVFKIKGALDQKGNPHIGKDVGVLLGESPLGVNIVADPRTALQETDVLIDFTHPSSLPVHLKLALSQKVGYVVGTTGLRESQIRKIRLAAKKIPIVQSPNMSVGVNLLFKLAEITAKALDESYDIEVVEAHHRMKKDAPSGTALKIVEVLSQARGKSGHRHVVTGRSGEPGARPRGEIGVFALRGGDVIGDHTISFLGDAERVELIHKASSREVFALGALRAAKFVAQRANGFYNMQQVLGIS